MKNEKMKVELTPELVKVTYDEICHALEYLDIKKRHDANFFNRYVCTCIRMKIEEANETASKVTEQQEQPMTDVKENLAAIEMAKRTASCLWMTVICGFAFFALCANNFMFTLLFILLGVAAVGISCVVCPKWLRTEWMKVFSVEV